MTDTLILSEDNTEATHAQLAEIISLRDYMAMSALGALLDLEYNYTAPAAARMAYEIADAMLEERDRNAHKS